MIENISKIPDLANADLGEGDRFDIALRHDTNFKIDSEEYNLDPDFDGFSVLCQSYVKSSSLLITSHVETSDYLLNDLVSKMKNPLYAMIVNYDVEGKVIHEEILKIKLNYTGPVKRADNSVMTKAFIFNIEH